MFYKKDWERNIKIWYCCQHLKQAEVARMENLERERIRQIINVLEPHRETLLTFQGEKKLGEVLKLLKDKITSSSLVERIKNETKI